MHELSFLIVSTSEIKHETVKSVPKGFPKKTVLRHSGDISPAMQVQYVGCLVGGYILFLVLSSIRFLPYTFSLLPSISFNTKKENHAPFLGGKDTQRKPF